MCSAFLELGLCPELADSLPFHLPTPVQAEAIPLILGGGDVCVSAETGSGKTAAFGLSCTQIVHEVKTGKCLLPGKACTALPDEAMARTGSSGFRFPAASWSFLRGSVAVPASCRSGVHFSVEFKRPFSGEIRLGWVSSEASDVSAPVGTGSGSWGLACTSSGSLSLVSNGKQTPVQLRSPGSFPKSVVCTLSAKKNEVIFNVDGQLLPDTLPLPLPLPLSPAAETDVLLRLRPVVCGCGDAELHSVDFSHVRVSQTQTDARPHRGNSGSANAARPYCVVVTPTNPLVDQTVKVLGEFGRNMQPAVAVVAAGAGNGSSGVADVVVGTPQKLKTQIETGKLSVDRVLLFVLDEADELIKNDKERVLQFLHAKVVSQSSSSAHGRVQTLLFSATLKTPDVQKAIAAYCRAQVSWVDTNLPDQLLPATVHHAVLSVDSHSSSAQVKTAYRCIVPDATPFLDQVHDTGPGTAEPEPESSEEAASLRVKRRKMELVPVLADEVGMDRCVVFCRTNLDCDNLEKYLLSLDKGKVGAGERGGREHKYSCCVLAGFREASEKRRNLELFQEGGIRFLICTDVAARGVDIRGLPYLINVTLPDDCDNYVHRIGRVGRAEHMGLAISLVSTVKEKVWFHANCKNRGRDGCRNRKLLSQGGCCVWYDEPALLKAVEKKIKAAVPPFLLGKPALASAENCCGPANRGNSLAVQGRLAQKLATLSEQKTKVVYGERKPGAEASALSGGFRLPAAVAELMEVETQLQRKFLANRF